MINVLHLINYPGKGGAERYILSLIEKLNNKGCRFYIAYSEKGPMIKQARDMGVKTFNIPMKNPYDLKAAVRLKALCRELHIDVVHTHFLRENYVSIFSKLIGNRVVLINTNHLLNDKSVSVKRVNKLLTCWDDRIIAVSNAVKDRLVSEGVNPFIIQVIHNGVDMRYWKGRPGFNIRKELGIEKEDFVVTSVARFSHEKGHIFLMEVIKEFKKIISSEDVKMPVRIKFVLVGEGEMFDECKTLSKIFGIYEDIVFTGFRSDVKSILLESDLYISHSESEALGLPILEALAVGLPVVATNAGGPSEIINEQNRCGIIVDYGDVEGFAKAIIKLATNEEFYTMCKANTTSTILDKFNLDNTVWETYNLYKTCVEEKSSRKNFSKSKKDTK